MNRAKCVLACAGLTVLMAGCSPKEEETSKPKLDATAAQAPKPNNTEGAVPTKESAPTPP